MHRLTRKEQITGFRRAIASKKTPVQLKAGLRKELIRLLNEERRMR